MQAYFHFGPVFDGPRVYSLSTVSATDFYRFWTPCSEFPNSVSLDRTDSILNILGSRGAIIDFLKANPTKTIDSAPTSGQAQGMGFAVWTGLHKGMTTRLMTPFRPAVSSGRGVTRSSYPGTDRALNSISRELQQAYHELLRSTSTIISIYAGNSLPERHRDLFGNPDARVWNYITCPIQLGVLRTELIPFLGLSSSKLEKAVGRE